MGSLNLHPFFSELDELIADIQHRQTVKSSLTMIQAIHTMTRQIGERPQAEMLEWFSKHHPEKTVPIENRCEGVGGQQRSPALQDCFVVARSRMAQWAKTQEDLTPQLLMDLNASLRGIPLGDTASVMCSFQNFVKGPNKSEPRYVAAPAHLLDDLLIDFCDWLNHRSTDESQVTHTEILKALLTQFVLCQIHPFFDGNGRTSRALTTALLNRLSIELQVPALELIYVWDRRAYEDAILVQPRFDMPLNKTRALAFLDRMISEIKRASYLRLRATATLGAMAFGRRMLGTSAPNGV